MSTIPPFLREQAGNRGTDSDPSAEDRRRIEEKFQAAVDTGAAEVEGFLDAIGDGVIFRLQIKRTEEGDATIVSLRVGDCLLGQLVGLLFATLDS